MKIPRDRFVRPSLAASAAAASVIALLAPLAAPSLGQSPEIRGVITGEGARRVPLAVTQVFSADPKVAGYASEIQRTLLDDLSYSGYFDIVDPSRFSGFKPPSPDSVDMKPWLSIGADDVLAPRLAAQQGQIALEGRLYDSRTSVMVFGKRFSSEADLVRRLAHRLASEVIAHFTGQPGVPLTRIAFVSRHGEAKDLYVMDYDGQRIRRLTTSQTINLTPAWSPDGTRLAFTSFRGRSPAVYIIESDGRITRLPTGGADPASGGSLNLAPDWSPDGRRIAYSSTREGNCEVYVIEPASGRETRLTHDPGIDVSPSWSPTGKQIVFTSDRGGTPQLYTMDSDGANVQRITFDGVWNDSASWSPKGDRIAYVSRIEGKFALMLRDQTTQRSVKLVSGPFNCENPHWSPDGRHLVFASDRGGSWQIWAIDADGANARKLTQGEPCFTPHWSR